MLVMIMYPVNMAEGSWDAIGMVTHVVDGSLGKRPFWGLFCPLNNIAFPSELQCRGTNAQYISVRLFASAVSWQYRSTLLYKQLA